MNDESSIAEVFNHEPVTEPGEQLAAGCRALLKLQQVSRCCTKGPREGVEFVSDYFDFSIYIDADVKDIEEWYMRRFFTLRESVFRNPNSFFRNFATLDDDLESVFRYLVDPARSRGPQ